MVPVGSEHTLLPNMNLNQLYANVKVKDDESTSAQVVVKLPDGSDQLMNNVQYIRNSYELREQERDVNGEWKYLAVVIDRMFFFIFASSCIVVSIYVAVEVAHTT